MGPNLSCVLETLWMLIFKYSYHISYHILNIVKDNRNTSSRNNIALGAKVRQ
jgi:hypothetical protein